MRFYGNKTKLLDFIEKVISDTTNLDPNATTFCDPFTGTTAVAQHFKKRGYTVHASDFLNLSHVLAKAYIELDSDPSFDAFKNIYGQHPIDWLNTIEGKVGFITRNYAPVESGGRKYFSVANAMKIDAIREVIDQLHYDKIITDLEKFYLIAALLEAINLVSNVSGTYGSFMKAWDKRALKTMALSRLDIVSNGKQNQASLADVRDSIGNTRMDILYLDPPYNSRQYASNYFLPELIAEGWMNRVPAIYGYTGMRPYDSQKSEFCMKNKAYGAMKHVVSNTQSRYVFISYNNEGILTKDQIVSLLSERGSVVVYEFKHKRYRSVGQDGTKAKTIEYLFATEVTR